MKKITLIAVSIALATVSSQAQGLVNLNNSVSAGSHISTNSAVGSVGAGQTAATAGLFYYALFCSVSATNVHGSAAGQMQTGLTFNPTVYANSDPNWTFQGMATNAGSVGRISGPASLVLTGISGGGTAQYVLLGWSGNLGSTYQLAMLAAAAWTGATGPAWLGESAVSPTITAGDGVNIPTPVMVAASGAITGFTLGLVQAVPEPGTLALAVLGGASLLLFRRKK